MRLGKGKDVKGKDLKEEKRKQIKKGSKEFDMNKREKEKRIGGEEEKY